MDSIGSRFTFHASRLVSHLGRRIRWLFGTTPGLLLVVTAWDALLVALLSPFSGSGPLAGLDLLSRLGLGLDEGRRVGRIIMLYHSLAVPFVAALVYFILDLLPFGNEKRFLRLVRPTITVGYMLASAGGIGFAYLGWGWIAHGLFLVGLSLVFYAGVVLCVGLFPWRRGLADEGFSLEQLAFWLVALCTLISAAIGGATGAYFGNGFSAFLAEDVIRLAHDMGQRAIIAHLHIMLTLIDVALLLIVARRFGLRGRAHNVAMGLVVTGTTIASFATWGVMAIEEIAHKIINVGAFLLLAAAAIVAVQGFARLVEERPNHEGRGWSSWGRRLRALLGDPVRFGLLFELIFVNVVVTVPGVYVAFNLETYRQPAFLEVERAIAVGHWHVLATLSAVIALFLVVDRLGVRGFLRQMVGWGVLGGSTLAFVFVQFYMFRQPGQEVGWALPFLDAGLALFLAMLAVFLSVQLVGMISREGGIR
jgi:hypothetical protein